MHRAQGIKHRAWGIECRVLSAMRGLERTRLAVLLFNFSARPLSIVLSLINRGALGKFDFGQLGVAYIQVFEILLLSTVFRYRNSCRNSFGRREEMLKSGQTSQSIPTLRLVPFV